MKTKFMTFAMMMAMLGITSCSKTDLYDEGKIAEMEAAEAAAAQQKLIAEYEANFIKTFGEINPNQSWDFSTNDVKYTLNGPIKASTRATRADLNLNVNPSTTYYGVQQKTLTMMNTVFKEGKDNSGPGTFFGLNAPKNSFTIQPIFMGKSGGNFKLYLHVEGVAEDRIIWEKWQGIQYKKEGSSDWETLSSTHNEGGENLVNATAIQTQPITISGIPEGTEMWLYLKISQAASGYNSAGDIMGSHNGFMKEYTFTNDQLDLYSLPGVEAGKQVQCKLIGCEDANTAKSDKDFNDVVFLLYGQPEVPTSFKIKTLTEDLTKRYMIEDLGATDDFDFNDIVVDVTSHYEAQIKVDDNDEPLPGYENPEYTYKSSYAEIKALGGTLDFELTIGNTKWKKSENFADYTEMINTKNPDYNAVLKKFDVAIYDATTNPEGYNPTANNISVTVYQKDTNRTANVVGFPKNGAVPMMIATDAKVEWATERARFSFEQFQNAE